MKTFHFILMLCCLPIFCLAETDFYFENNTTLDFNITTTQWSTDSDPLENDEWNPFNGTSYAWQSKLRVLRVNRDEGIHNGKNFYQEVMIEHNGEYVVLQCWLEGEFIGSDMNFSIRGMGFDHSWHGQNNGNFHEEMVTIAGKQMLLKYKRENNIPYEENVRFALHELEPYQNPDPAELTNPNVMNLFCYNVGLLMPAGVADHDENERSEHLPSRIPTDADVIVTQEAFDVVDDFLNGLFPNYNHSTNALNEDNVDIPGVTKDGGVYILSKWPIEVEADLDFQGVGIPCDNGAWNCAARKGVKYARINKLGTKYHIFGTHLEAGNSTIRLEQLDSFKTFVESFNIPEDEAVLFAGDFNIGLNDSENDYQYILNNLSAVEPTRLGHPYATTTSDFNQYHDTHTTPGGRIIDHVFSAHNHLMPVSGVNEAWTMRSIHDDMWDIYDLSDHEAVLARFEYPEVLTQPIAADFCWQETAQISTTNSINPANYQWFKDGQALSGETNMFLDVYPFDEGDSGLYHCETTYSYTPDVAINSLLTEYTYNDPGLIYNNLASDAVTLNLTVSDCTPTIEENSGLLEVDYTFGTYQWYDENGPIAGATDPNFEPTASGTYYVVVSYDGNDSNPSNEIVIVINSNDEILGNAFNLSPNPSTGLVHLQFENTLPTEIRLDLYNQHGQLVYSQNTSQSTSIQLDFLAKGIYHLKIGNDTEFIVRKIVLK